jgi:hypothetical protein
MRKNCGRQRIMPSWHTMRFFLSCLAVSSLNGFSSNGSEMLDVIEAITKTHLERIQISERMYIRVGWSEKFDAPILVHGFVNSPGGPQSAQQFKLVAEAFRNWIGDDSHFEFH